MNVGDIFNPWRGDEQTPGCGFNPADVVGMQRHLTDGQKRLYERLVRFAGRNGDCFPSQQTLAELLGKSDRQVRSDLNALESARLIARRSRDGRRSNTYVFLWHEMFEGNSDRKRLDDLSGSPLPVKGTDATAASGFERQSTSGQTDDVSGSPLPVNGFERKPTSGQLSGSPLPVKPFERKDSVNLSGSGLPPNSVHRNKTLTLQDSGRLKEQSDASAPQAGFQEFQSAYPEPKQNIKVDSSCRAYLSVIDGKPGEHERLMAGLDRWKASAQWQNSMSHDRGRFIPYMENFLFERRYLDHPPAADEARDEYQHVQATDEFIPANAKMPDWGV